jgi:two-component system, response regulator, stage 0 sporulation protein F
MDNRPTILYVDDEPLNLELFVLNFEDKYTILTADSPFVGLEVISLHPYVSIVISDMMMPHMNGLDFIKCVRELQPNMVCFILTGFDLSQELMEALNNRIISKYLCKPFDVKAIEKAIAEANAFA